MGEQSVIAACTTDMSNWQATGCIWPICFLSFFLSVFLSFFASHRSLQNDNRHAKKDITVKFSAWNLKDLTRILS
jgi:hypothetical protein